MARRPLDHFKERRSKFRATRSHRIIDSPNDSSGSRRRLVSIPSRCQRILSGNTFNTCPKSPSFFNDHQNDLFRISYICFLRVNFWRRSCQAREQFSACRSQAPFCSPRFDRISSAYRFNRALFAGVHPSWAGEEGHRFFRWRLEGSVVIVGVGAIEKVGDDPPVRSESSMAKVGHCSLMVSDSAWSISSAASR